MFHKDVWLGFDCFPTCSALVDHPFMSDTATQVENDAYQDPAQGNRTDLCDCAQN